jgi:catechol 2,3-dioxygenase-like lactoylglutathione lyase family enzyme
MASFRDPFPILEVADIRRSLAFYADLLGFQTTYGFPSPDDPQFVALELAGRELGLSVADGRVETASTSICMGRAARVGLGPGRLHDPHRSAPG